MLVLFILNAVSSSSQIIYNKIMTNNHNYCIIDTLIHIMYVHLSLVESTTSFGGCPKIFCYRHVYARMHIIFMLCLYQHGYYGCQS